MYDCLFNWVWSQFLKGLGHGGSKVEEDLFISSPIILYLVSNVRGKAGKRDKNKKGRIQE